MLKTADVVKSVAVIVLVVAGASRVAGQEKEPAPPARFVPKLYPVKVDGKWGYINATGRVVVDPRYDHAMPFYDGRAIVHKDRKLLILDGAGTLIAQSPFAFDHGSFSEGFAHGPIGHEFGFIDSRGKLLPRIFDGAEPFSEGLAAACHNPGRREKARGDFGLLSPGKWGFINPMCEWVIAPEYYYVGRFSHGLAPVYVGGMPGGHGDAPGGKWGFVDKSGRMVIEPKFESASPFSEGLAMVRLGGNDCGYINTKGEFVIEPRPFLRAHDFHEGLAAIRGGETTGGKGRGGVYYKGFGFMDNAGKVIIPEEFGDTSDFSEGLAAARASRGGGEKQWGYVDKNGKWVVKPQFDHAGPYRGGLAIVEQDRKVGYLNPMGEFVWPLTK